MLSAIKRAGFTLIELLVVLSIVALLASLAVPRYMVHVERTKEAVLRENLHQMRDAIDKFHGDHGRYPNELKELVTGKYLRQIPPDPITDSAATWVAVAPVAGSGKPAAGKVADVRSGAPGKGRDGTAYGSW